MNRKDWRPPDWDIMNYCTVEEQKESPLLAMHFFEAGADAMLEAIWKLAKESQTGAFVFDSNAGNIYYQ
ncbi:hypothetical protein LCGC14_1147780 [marine sediment metagenome]|uniref:Uncharacterized protein n=1 Tax=marine sediment metagenome TaxID=412755 RepID=A0A0F9MJN7_9ZZZZ